MKNKSRNKDGRPVLFYRETESYGCFSNFSKHSIELEGKRWATTEHYFQAKKFEGTKYEEMVRKARSAGEAKKIGGRRDLPLRKDWERVKEKVMYIALKAKFTQHEDIKRILLRTGDRKIVENARRDYYWGCGASGNGKNRLGILLMELRAEIREEDQMREMGKDPNEKMNPYDK